VSATRSLPRVPRVSSQRAVAVGRRLSNPWVVVPAIVLIAFAVTVNYVLKLSEYFVMPDELAYVKQGLAIWDKGFFLTSGDYGYNSMSQLLPLVQAPVWGLGSPSSAFDAGHVVNALIMTSTAIPVYLLSRRVLADRGVAYAVAALSVFVPWIALSGSFLSETVAYPAFAWAVLGMQRTLVEPSLRADALALGGLLLAFVARTQFYLLAIVLLIAVVVHEVAFRRSVRAGVTVAARGHVLLLGAAALALLVGSVTGTWESLLGNYATVQNGTLLPAGTWGQGRELLDYVVADLPARS